MSEIDPQYLRAQGNYADVINRTVDKYSNTPGGAPPGVMIEGMLQTQAKPEFRMTTGTGVPQGLAALALDSEDARLFQEKYGREAEMWNPEEAIDVVVNATDMRQERGGAYAEWFTAALGITGVVDETGLKKNISDEQHQRAIAWYRDLAGFIRERTPGGKNDIGPGIDRMNPGSTIIATNEETGKEELVVSNEADYKDNPGQPDTIGDDVGDVVSGVLDPITGGVDNLVNAVTGWLPRIGFFIVGAVLLMIGVWLLVRPGAPGGKPRWAKR